MKTTLKIGLSLLFALAFVSPLAAETVDATGGSGVKEIEVTNRGLVFSVSEMRVNVGDTVRVTYTNGGGRHDWVLDEFDGAQTDVIKAGESQTVEFVADRAGSFEFYCSVPGHRQAGMYGTFVVVE
ncbi:MAG: cupredoxin domain-containing protein [Spirochaeta sp.]|nr:cupredoxin domain-containing protein [Spirochaeta sp.]